jgi:hypothetical protein
MSSRRRFKRQTQRTTPEWFPKILEQMQRCGVDTTPSPDARRQKRPAPQLTSVAYGALIDALMLKDRAYFEAHPEETEYIRPAEPGDAPEHTVLDPAQHWQVRVTHLAEGIRTRYIFGVPFLPSEREPARN